MPEGRGFDSRRRTHRNFFINLILSAPLWHLDRLSLWQKWVSRGKGSRCVGLTTLPPLWGDRLEMMRASCREALRACPGVLYVIRGSGFWMCELAYDWTCVCGGGSGRFIFGACIVTAWPDRLAHAVRPFACMWNYVLRVSVGAAGTRAEVCLGNFSVSQSEFLRCTEEKSPEKIFRRFRISERRATN